MKPHITQTIQDLEHRIVQLQNCITSLRTIEGDAPAPAPAPEPARAQAPAPVAAKPAKAPRSATPPAPAPIAPPAAPAPAPRRGSVSAEILHLISGIPEPFTIASAVQFLLSLDKAKWQPHIETGNASKAIYSGRDRGLITVVKDGQGNAPHPQQFRRSPDYLKLLGCAPPLPVTDRATAWRQLREPIPSPTTQE
jgi:hypothetical protein